MRQALFPILLLLMAGIAQTVARLAPLDTKGISLMLRSGYSSEAVLRELASRRFADIFDSASEKQLARAGATESLLAALRSGIYAMSPLEIAALEKARTLREDRAASNGGQLASPPAAALPTNPSAVPRLYQFLKDKLVYCREGSIVHYDDEPLANKKLYLFFFSANWSPPARKFTPFLLEYYERLIAQHPEVEVIFFSADRSRFGMETYMSQSRMPWPAADYDKLVTQGFIPKDLIHGIPSLVLVDADGKVLSNSYGGEQDLGPGKVLADLDKLLAGGLDHAR
jgi:nucleoredoxin